MIKKYRNTYFIWIGFIVTVIVGTLMHFAYDFFGMNKVVGIFSPINESVWEHLKLVFYPFTIFSIIFYFYSNRELYNMFIAVAFGNIVAMLTVVTSHYIFEMFVTSGMLFFSIAMYIIGMFLAFYSLYFFTCNIRFLSYSEGRTAIGSYGIFVLIFLFVVFTLFTFYPPKLGIFEDPVTKTYGIFKSGN